MFRVVYRVGFTYDLGSGSVGECRKTKKTHAAPGSHESDLVRLFAHEVIVTYTTNIAHGYLRRKKERNKYEKFVSYRKLKHFYLFVNFQHLNTYVRRKIHLLYHRYSYLLKKNGKLSLFQ